MNDKRWDRIWLMALALPLIAVLVFAGYCWSPLVSAQGGTPTPDEFSGKVFRGCGGDCLVVADGGTLDLQSGATLSLDTYIDQPSTDQENIGLPSVLSAAVTYESSGALWTVADGEIWLVHDVFFRTTTNFDCTGDNCTLTIGDGNDTDGFVVLADADVQAAATEQTGSAAGWFGLLAANKGVYLDGSGGPQTFIYAPSGAAETIDIAIGGTDPAAGVGVAYIIYTRIL